MAVIYVPGAFSGTQYAVNIAGDVPTPAEQARIDQYVAQQESAFQSRYESMFGAPGETEAAPPEDTTAFGRSVDIGLAGLGRAYGSTLEGIGTVTGLESLAGYGAGVAERQGLELDRLAEAAALEREREAQGAIGSAATYIGEIAGASAPQTAVSLAGGYAGAKAGAAIGAFAGPVGAVVGGTVGALGGAALASLPYFYGDFREQQKEADIEAGRPVEVSEGAAALAATSASLLDGVLSAVGAKYGANVLKKAAEGGLFTRAARGAAGGVAIEVPTELGQELLGILQAGKDPLSEEAIQRYGEAALGAAVLGGGIGAAGGALVTGRKEEAERKKRELDEDMEELGARGDQYIQNARESRAAESAEKVASPEAAPLALPAPSTARTTPQEETALRGRAGMEAITPTRPVALTSLPMEERVAISQARANAGREPSPEVTLEELQAIVGTAASEREAKKQKPVTGGIARFGPVENKTFTQDQYDRAVQQVKADKGVSFPKIQKAVRDITKAKVPNTVVRDIRDEMVSRGVIRADTKSRTGYSLEPIARTDSIETGLRQEIDGLNKQIDLSQKERKNLIEEVRRVEQTGKDSTGKRADPALFNQKLDTLDASIEAAKARVAAAETEIKNAKQAGAIPSVERVALDAAKVAVPVTEATAPAIQQRMETLRQNIAGYNQQIGDAEKQAANLRKRQKKVQLNNAQKARLQQLEQTAADLKKLRDTATARLRDPSATVQAAKEREAAGQARFNAATMKEPVNYTPIFTAQQQKVFGALRKRLNNLGLKDVRLEGAQAMLARDQSGRVMGVAEGKYDPVKRIISLSMGIYRKGMTDQELFDSIASVMNHEVIHALRLMGVLTDAEWSTLTTYAKNKKYVAIKQGKPVERSYTYEERARAMGYDEAVIQEEAVAELFRDYLDGKTTVKGPQKTIFERLKNFFKAIIGVHTERGFDSVEKIFEGIRYGEIGARPRGAAPVAQAAAPAAVPTAEADVSVDDQLSPEELADLNRQLDDLAVAIAADPRERKSFMPVPSPVKNRDGTDSYSYGNIIDYRGRKQSVILPVGEHIFRERGVDTGYGLKHIIARKHDQELYEMSKYKDVNKAIFDMLQVWKQQGMRNGDSVIGGKDGDQFALEWIDNRPLKAPRLRLVLSENNRLTPDPFHYVHSFYPSETRVYERGPKPYRRFSMVLASEGAFKTDGVYDREKVADFNDWAEGQAITRIMASGDTEDRISTRQPYTKRATEDPLTQNLIVDLNAMKQSPQAFAHNMQVIKGYPGFVTASEDPDQIAEDFIQFVSDNLLWLHNRVPQEIRKRSKLWYNGARKIAERMSGQYQIPDFTVAGVLAALSPQKDWYQNVSLAERLIDIHQTFSRGNMIAFTPTVEMAETAQRIYGKEQYAPALRIVMSNSYAGLEDPVLKAMWLRLYDETYNPRGYRTVSAEGDFIGDPSGKVGWGSNVEIAKAIYVLTHQSREATSLAMGDQHKVRNFFNNILAPDAPHGDVTIDTHAVAAALIRPLSGSSAEVHHNFGSSPAKAKQPQGWIAAKSIGDTGAIGVYGIYAEAYRRTAGSLGITARELQSITWEAVRGLFPAEEKRSKAKVARVNGIWREVNEGKRSVESARDDVERFMGGINEPTWFGPGGGAAGKIAPSSYEGELAGVRLDRSVGRRASGASVGYADRVEGIGRGAGAAGGGIRPRQRRITGGREADRYSAVPGRGVGGLGTRETEARTLAAPERAVALSPLEPLPGAPRVEGFTGPDPSLVRIADKYAKSIGLDLSRQSEYVDVDPERAARIAAAYDAMPHAPQDPKVREAYQNLIRQTLAQYNALAQDGYQFWFTDLSRPDNEAYLSSPWNALRDIRANKQMGVFPTAGGFGSGATELNVEDNPMLEDTGLRWPVGSPDSEQTAPVLANDLFRAVHDAFGHGLEGSGFRARGEENAWQAHVRLFTGSAVGAITSETRGQNSWLNYGPYGDSNRNAKVEDTVFADQKTGLMPDWTWTEGRAGDMPAQEPTSAPSPTPLVRQSMVPTRNSVAGNVQRQTAQKQTNVVYSKAADLLAKGLRITGIGADDARSKQIADGIIKKFQDGMIPVGRMIDELRANGLNITDAMDTYMQEELYHGVVGEKVEQAQTNLYRPLIDLVGSLKVTDQAKQQLIAASNSASVGRGFADVAFNDTRSNALSMADIFLYASHAKERNEYIRGIDPENDAGSGMTDGEADAILAWFASSPYASTMQKIADATQRIVQSTNDVRLEGGLIPREFFQYTDPTTGDTVDVPQYDNYVPLRGKRDPSGEPVDEQATGPYRSPMYGARRREDRRSLGRYDYADNIIPNLLVQNQNAIIRAERNKVGQSFLQLLRSDPAKTKAYGRILKPGDMKDVQKRVLVERKRADGTVVQTVQTVLDPNFRNEPDIFVVKEDGKEVIVKLESDAIASALKGSMSPTHNNGLIRALATINRYLASINTSLNPAFFITNMFRDLQTAGVNVAQYEIDGLTRKIVRDVPGALRGIKQSIRNNDNSSEWARIYRDFVKNGGQNATNQVNTVADQMNNISGIIGDIADSGARKQFNRVKNGFVGKGAMSLLSFVEDYNTVIENGIRVTTYKALLDKGFTPQRAAQAARNITVNFAKGGDYKTFMNAMYLFYNASLQGSFAMLNAALRSKKVQKFWAAAIGVGIMQDYLNAIMSGDDEDGEKLYDKIPEYVLEHNLILPDVFGFTDRSYISIPMPYGLNMAHNLGRAMGRLSRGAYEPSEAAGSIVGTMLDTVNPIGGSESFANAASPTVLDPFIDIWQNENFANQPVYKEGFPGDRTPSSQLYWSTTSVPAVWLANAMNSVTGGTTEVKGMVDVSPDLIDFWFEYLTGGVGRFVIRTAETPFRAYDEGFSEDVVRNVPIFGKIIGTVTTREDTGAYVEKRNRVLTALDEVKAAVEEGNTERLADARERFSDELKVSGAVRAIDNALRKLSRQMRQVREGRLPEDQKRLILERLDERRQQLTARANQLMRDI